MQRNKNIKRRDNNRLIPSPVGESKVLVSTLDISNIKPKSVLSFIQNIHIINTLRLESILPSNIIAFSPMSISIEQKMLKSNLYSISNTKNTYISYFHQICDILHRFHSTNYIYDNLKPSNILLNKNGDIYISDYFLNEIRDLRNTNYPNIRRYLSPEQMESKEISFSTDIWSLGMILYFICEKKEYNNYNNNIRNGRIKLTNNSNYNTRLYELLINKMIKVNPSQRISLDEILLIIKRNDLTIIDDNWINSVKMYEFIKENAYILYYEYYHKLDYMLRSKIDYKLMDTSLTELNFEWSDIGDIGCEYLYDNLRSLTSVINLNLWANLIFDKGLYYINLKYFNNLKYMNLGCIFIFILYFYIIIYFNLL